MEKFVLVSGDGFPRMYGQGARGMGHALLIEDGFWGDPLAVGGKITRACGKTLDAGKAVEKFVGDKRCPECVAWLATENGTAEIDRARSAFATWEDGGESVRAFIADTLPEFGTDGEDSPAAMAPGAARDAAVREIWTGGSDPDPVATRKAAVARERKRLADQREKRDAAKRENSDSEVIASVGLTHAEMVAKTATYYANGGKVPAEIEKLPVPGTVNVGSLESGNVPPVIPCKFRGGVKIINPEKTHGKCPGCSAYIPLLPEMEVRESAPKVSKVACSGIGSAPVAGSRVSRDDHSVSLPDDFPGKHSGKCPECARIIAVSREGGMRKHNGVEMRDECAAGVDRIGTHNAGGVATPQIPASKRLVSHMIETVEHSSVPGDTSTANKRRTDESRCKRGNKVLKDATGGTVECPECARPVELMRVERANGEISWKIPHHVRPGESVKHVGHGDVRDVTPRGEGADVGATVTRGPNGEVKTSARLALSRGHGSVDGAATTGSQNLPPVQPRGWLGMAGTGQLPATVRPGIDPEISGEICPLPKCKGQRKDVAHKGKSKGWRRRHSSKMGAYLAGRTEKRAAERAAAIERGEIASVQEKRDGRKAASLGSFADGTCAGVVSHETRPEFAPKGERRPAGWKAGKVTRDAARTALDSVNK